MGIRELVFQVLFFCAAGTLVSFSLVRRAAVGGRYFLYHGLIAIAAALTGYAFASPLSSELVRWFWGFVMTGSAASVLPSIYPRAYPFALAATSATALGTLVALDPSSWVNVANALLSAVLLGLSLNALCLGHWYLVQPKLSIDELARQTLALIATLLLRGITITVEVAFHLAGKGEAEIYHYLFSTTPGLFLLMRLAWGILVPLGLSYLLWGTVRIRSTQSATGILYVIVLALLAGEILARYLALLHGIAV